MGGPGSGRKPEGKGKGGGKKKWKGLQGNARDIKKAKNTAFIKKMWRSQ